MNDGPFILRVLQSALGLYGAIYLATSIFAPRWFLDTLSINHIGRRRRRRGDLRGEPWWLWPTMVLTWLAVGVIVYAATYAIIAIVPYDWGGRNEDGEWQSTRYLIQIAVSFFGALALAMRVEKNAEILVWGPHERRARQAVSKAIRYGRDITPEIRERIATRTSEGLNADPLEYEGYDLEIAQDVQRWTTSEIRD